MEVWLFGQCSQNTAWLFRFQSSWSFQQTMKLGLSCSKASDLKEIKWVPCDWRPWRKRQVCTRCFWAWAIRLFVLCSAFCYFLRQGLTLYFRLVPHLCQFSCPRLPTAGIVDVNHRAQQEYGHLFLIFIRVHMGEYMTHVCRYPWRLKESISSPEASVPGVRRHPA